MRGIASIVVLLAAAGGLAGCGSDPADEPVGRDYALTSVALAAGGDPPPYLSDATRISFAEDGGRVSWRARCNMFDAAARLTESRVEIEEVIGTEIGCDPGRHREDEWLTDFFTEDPRWRLDGSELTLSTERAVIELTQSEETGG